jgi:hypothetical protein
VVKSVHALFLNWERGHWKYPNNIQYIGCRSSMYIHSLVKAAINYIETGNTVS